MIRRQFVLDLNDELIVDNFAGGGGASTGIEMALGRCVDHAANHDWAALGMHRINHPQTIHHCADIFEIDPETVCEGRRVGLCHSSPDCKHFSKAKGGMPLDKRIRGLALVILKWAKYGARVLTMENVEEIETWGPLKKINGEWRPDPAHKGRTWRAFLACLSTGIADDHPDLPEILDVLGGYISREECVRGFGYNAQHRIIRAANHGSPTIRKRLFMIARRDGRPIVWPDATHAEPKKLERGLKPERTIAECIDWETPCPSIFLSKEQARKARCKRPLVKATLRRVAKGVDRYVLKADRPFLVSLTHQGGDRVENIDAPANTITGAHRGEKALVAPVMSRFNGSHSGKNDGDERNFSMRGSLTTQDTSNRFSITEAKLAPFLTEHANASTQRVFPADEPSRTVCGEVKGGHFSLVTGTLIGAGGPTFSGKPKPVTAPMNAQTTENHTALVSATLVHTAHGDVDSKGRKRGRGAHGVNEPMPSVLASNDCAVAAVYVAQQNGGYNENPGHRADEPSSTISSKGSQQQIVAANLVKLRGTNVGQPADEPGHTISAGGTHHGLVAASLFRHFGKSVGQEIDGPAPTVVAGGGGKTGMIAASAVAYYGSDEDGQGIEEPARTVTTRDRLGLVESSLAYGLTEDQLAGALRVAAFLREYGVEFEGPFAMVGGYIIVDLGLRMLSPRELFRAQGFSDSYIIDWALVVDPKTGNVKKVKLTKEQQIRMCGNSVCPQVMEAIVRVNVPEMSTWYRRDGRKARRARKEVAA